MVLGLLAIAGIPTTIGVAEGISEGRKEKDPETEEERMRKFHLECFCEANGPKAKEIDGGQIVLRGEKLYIAPRHSVPGTGHPFEGFYIEYPDPERPRPLPLGLVSTISKDPPMLNWIYVDKNTREVKYGNRTQSRAHIVGSWGWDAGEEGGAGGLTLEGAEGAVAVEAGDGWEIRWEDEDGNAGVEGRRKVTISLERKMLEPKEEDKPFHARAEERDDDQVKRTNTNIEMTNTTFQRSKRTTGEPERMDKYVKKGAKEDHAAPKLEIRGTTVERPLAKK
ncbi:hypothetical protein IMSHALPRED_004566 [Imshaugia aleurites]|uniref:Uncharacterized protein n=1 Tax=Imshaugia aleurites TaxID=172621 RepID=A0A8H3F923_9LECA|nr:hypothetical protein IMSHALPRED_004566 [Imshaugia aleurites]